MTLGLIQRENVREEGSKEKIKNDSRFLATELLVVNKDRKSQGALIRSSVS